MRGKTGGQDLRKRDAVQKCADDVARQTVQDLPYKMRGNIKKNQQEKDLKIAADFFSQMDGGRDLQKAKTAYADTSGDKEDIDQIVNGKRKLQHSDPKLNVKNSIQ